MKKVLILLLFLISSYSYACSCLYSEFGIKDYQNANYILDGKITKIRRNENKLEKEITFKVRKSIKGNTKDIVKITTAFNSAACGLNVKENDRWLLFVYEYKGQLNVGLCGKNVRYSKRKGESNKQKRKNCKLRKKMIRQMKEFKKPSYNEQ